MVDKGPLADPSRDGQPSTITFSGLDFASAMIEWSMLQSTIFRLENDWTMVVPG
jgi:hypothetical protein